MQIARHPEADQELQTAAIWYDQRQPGLGFDFLDEFERTLRFICDDPLRWPKFWGENRKCNFHRFPYSIVYSFDGETVYLRAVMHLHRRPLYWRTR